MQSNKLVTYIDLVIPEIRVRLPRLTARWG